MGALITFDAQRTGRPRWTAVRLHAFDPVSQSNGSPSAVPFLYGAGLVAVAAGVVNQSARLAAVGLVLANLATARHLGRLVDAVRRDARVDPWPAAAGGAVDIDGSNVDAELDLGLDADLDVPHWPAALEPVERFPWLRGDEPYAPPVLRTVRWTEAA